MSSDELLGQIFLYKRKILKYSTEVHHDEKILYYIHKLKYSPVSIKHLEETDIGRVVNVLTNWEGKVGSKSTILIKMWKDMVAQADKLAVKRREEESHPSKSRTPEEEEEEDAFSEPGSDSDAGSCLQIEENRESDKEDKYMTYQDKTDNDVESQNGYNPLTSRQDYLNAGQKHSNSSYTPSKYNPSEASVSPTPSDSPNSKGNLNSILDDEAISVRPSSQKLKKKTKTKEDKNKSKEDKSKHRDNRSKSKEDRSKPKDSKSKRKDKSPLTLPIEKGSSQVLSKPAKERESLIKEKESSSGRHSDSKEKDGLKSKGHGKKEHKHKRSKSDERKSQDGKTKSKDTPLKSPEASRKPKKEHSKSKSSHDGHRTSHSKESPSTNDTEAPTSKKRINTSRLEHTQHSSKKTKKSQNESTEVVRTEPPVVPCLLSSYKPLPKVPERLPSKDTVKNHDNEEGLNFMFSLKKKRQRTMYTGNPTGFSSNISALTEMCIKVLLENLYAIRGKSFIEVHPVLERATPQQLLDIEYYNPYILDDSSCLWELHCKKLFKTQRRQEMETWRDMFQRCTSEYQEKLENVTKILQRKYITKAEPKRTTQLAYVNPNQRHSRSLARAKVTTYPSEQDRLPKKEEQHQMAKSAGYRQERIIQRSPVKKARMAPLMAKTLQLHKKVCRR